jgi:rSAM/selenodomain-associated transferase 1
VKTRLAAEIGAAAALEFYRCVLSSVLGRLARETEWTTVAAVTPDEAVAHPFFSGSGAEAAPQGPGDLGERIARFLAPASPDAPVLVVGSDVPDLGARHVRSALEALKTHDLAIGPCPDGGYWLIGAARPPGPRLFDNVRWSSAHARADTLANAHGPVALLEELEDVDDAADYRRFMARR